MTRPPVFLDRDGVINCNRHDYVKGISEFVPIQGAIESIVRLCRNGHPVIVVTNQSCIGRNLCDESTVRSVNEHLARLVSSAGGRLSGVYYCPHHPDEGCDCRKPAIGMIETAIRDLDLPNGGFMVGDAASDIQLGINAGLRTIMVMTGRGAEQLKKLESEGVQAPWRIAVDLAEAVEMILASCSDTG